MRKKVRKKADQEPEKEEVIILDEKDEKKPEVKMTPVEEEQEPMTPLAAASPMKTETKK
ncbi:hypothetical protein [Algoriphagus sp.]|uniref:hypothetical protein n=1 Tax=Algoriphagus sp. TaxID=1872435 RepID=UPI003F6F36F8